MRTVTKGKCICGYEGEFDMLYSTSSDGYGALILNTKASDPDHLHKGKCELAVCPICSTVKVNK